MQVHHCAICGRSDVRLYRYYGSFLRPEEIYCLRHQPEDERSFFVPLLEDPDGSVWGYSSATEDSVRRWRALPDA